MRQLFFNATEFIDAGAAEPSRETHCSSLGAVELPKGCENALVDLFTVIIDVLTNSLIDEPLFADTEKVCSVRDESIGRLVNA